MSNFSGTDFCWSIWCSVDPKQKSSKKSTSTLSDELVGAFNPSEKYESQLGWLIPIYGKIQKMATSPHQPVNHLQSEKEKGFVSFSLGCHPFSGSRCETTEADAMDSDGLRMNQGPPHCCSRSWLEKIQVIYKVVPQFVSVQLDYNSNVTMVYGWYWSIFDWDYNPTNITGGAPPCMEKRCGSNGWFMGNISIVFYS